MTFVLASSSPRRVDLLAAAGYHFEKRPSLVDELRAGDLSAIELAEANAELKAHDIQKQLSQGVVVLGSDTVVSLGEDVMGKPRSLEEGRSMLWRLSGKKHSVYSGVCITNGEKTETFHVCSDVYFKELSDEIISEYHEKVEVLDKAGGYGAQSCRELIIERIDGEFENVMGLPMIQTQVVLAEFGIHP